MNVTLRRRGRLTSVVAGAGAALLGLGSCTTESVLRPQADIESARVAEPFQPLPALGPNGATQTGYGDGSYGTVSTVDPGGVSPAGPPPMTASPVAGNTFEAQLAALGETPQQSGIPPDPVMSQEGAAVHSSVSDLPVTESRASIGGVSAAPFPPALPGVEPNTPAVMAPTLVQPPLAAPILQPRAAPIVRQAAPQPRRDKPSIFGRMKRLVSLGRPENPVRSARGQLSQAESQCRRDLKKLKVQYVEIDPKGSGKGCGIARPVKVSAINGTAIQPAATLSCTTAKHLAGWTRDVLQPAARFKMWSRVASIKQMSSYSCRNIAGSRTLSEHGKGKAIDIGGFTLASGKYVPIEKKGLFALRQKGFQRKVRQGGCKYFSTVLGPGYNRAHADHLHFDMKKRRSRRGVCK